MDTCVLSLAHKYNFMHTLYMRIYTNTHTQPHALHLHSHKIEYRQTQETECKRNDKKITFSCLSKLFLLKKLIKENRVTKRNESKVKN